MMDKKVAEVSTNIKEITKMRKSTYGSRDSVHEEKKINPLTGSFLVDAQSPDGVLIRNENFNKTAPLKAE